MGLGKNIGRLRLERGLTYEEVAAGASIPDAQTVFQLVSRDSKKSRYAASLAKFFNVDVAELLSDEEPNVVALAHRGAHIPDGEKLLVLLKTFLDTDSSGREQIVKAAQSIAKGERDARREQRRGVKRR